MGKLGLCSVFACIKPKGTPVNTLVNALISYWLTENLSIEEIEKGPQSPIVRGEFEIPEKVSSRLLNSAVETTGKHMEETVLTSGFFITKRHNLPTPATTSIYFAFRIFEARRFVFLWLFV